MDPGGSEPSALGRGASSALLWSALFAPGLGCAALAVFVVDSAVLLGVGIALLLAPLLIQLFAADWGENEGPLELGEPPDVREP